MPSEILIYGATGYTAKRSSLVVTNPSSPPLSTPDACRENAWPFPKLPMQSPRITLPAAWVASNTKGNLHSAAEPNHVLPSLALSARTLYQFRTRFLDAFAACKPPSRKL
jgi:hypothetical protein